MHKQALRDDEAANHQLPIAEAFWIIAVVPMEECSILTQNLMQIHCSTHSVLLNLMATQYICSLNGVYHPHWLVQWSHHCSCMLIPVHSPWLPGYINVVQTVLIILTMAGFFFWKDPIYTLKTCARYISIFLIIYKLNIILDTGSFYICVRVLILPF